MIRGSLFCQGEQGLIRRPEIKEVASDGILRGRGAFRGFFLFSGGGDGA